jgi:hypothetical protein
MLIEKHYNINVLRDDILPGGTKSILMPHIIKDANEYVYASPVYGGFQIALSAYCQSVNKKATIFCAKRNTMHQNTLTCLSYGANIIEVPYGYLTVVEKRAKDYCLATGADKLIFGANSINNKLIIANRVKEVLSKIEVDEIWCAIGSGTLVESILMATNNEKIFGVQVGAEYINNDSRLTIMKYNKSFDKLSKFNSGFPSMANYDLKAFEYCVKYSKSKNVLFWNVL